MTSSRLARRFARNKLTLRVASAAVLIPAVLAAIFARWIFPKLWVAGWLFPILIVVGVALLAMEWGKMSARQTPWRVAGIVCAAALAALFFAYLRQFELAWLTVAAGAAVVAALAGLSGERPGDAAFGVAYIAGPCIALTWLRGMPNPISWTILLFAVTWSADICAYFVGTALKGPKLWPRWSPNKTWSGFAAGLLGAIGAAITMAACSTARLSLAAAALIGLAGGLATMAGDLCESMLKRRYGVKDSGQLIPGHGGLLDRVDGLLFATLAVTAARLIYQAGWGR